LEGIEAEILPDETCVAGEAAPKPEAKAAKSKKSKAEAARSTLAVVHAADAFIAYTDGACSGNPGPAGWGAVLVPPGGSPVEGYGYLGTATNNVAELTAILKTLECVPGGTPSLVLHTDSQYAIGVLTKGWKAKVNQELIAETKRALHHHPTCRLVYVPGHAGVPLNERADELAREAIRVGADRRLRLTP
jgi:ribonuclease HI